MRMEFSAGQHVQSAAEALVRAAREHGTANGSFNDIEMVADGSMDADAIVAKWSRDMDARSVAYRNSPEGKAAEARREAEVVRLQEVHDIAVQDLRTLDWSSDVAVLDWLCRIQDATDHVDVTVRKSDIIDEFHRHGYAAGANCGDAFHADDRDNVHRYIVGQALDGLASVAIHGIVHKFVADWKTRFVNRQP